MFRSVLACVLAFPLAALAQTPAPAPASQTVLPLWPHGNPEPGESKPVEEHKPGTNKHYPGRELITVSEVSTPTLTLFPVPAGIRPTGAAAIVFPGGGYIHLAMTHEGVMPCEWFNSLGVACVLVKYRIPWKQHFPGTYGPLEDAQQAVRLTRAHAAEWGIDPTRIGVLGFSAGGHLAVTLSQHFDDPHVLSTPAAADVDAKISARPDFVMLGYPAYLPTGPGERELDPNLTPNSRTPPTFIMQNEDDRKYAASSLVYARALFDANVPVMFVFYPQGGHGQGMHPTGDSNENWTALAADWLRRLKMIP